MDAVTGRGEKSKNQCGISGGKNKKKTPICAGNVANRRNTYDPAFLGGKKKRENRRVPIDPCSELPHSNG